MDRVFALANEFGLGHRLPRRPSAGGPSLRPSLHRREDHRRRDARKGHGLATAFALGHVPEDEHKHAIDLCAQAGVSICVTPYFSMRERVALPRQAGVNVSYMSDNIQDTWQPHGNGDMLLLAAFTARLTRSTPMPTLTPF